MRSWRSENYLKDKRDLFAPPTFRLYNLSLHGKSLCNMLKFATKRRPGSDYRGH